MTIYKILEYPAVYNLSQKILSLIAFGNKGIGNFLKEESSGNGETILDVGCGIGKYAFGLGKRYTGVDNNKEYIDYARDNYPESHFFASDSADLNFLKEKFDNVISINTFHHLSDGQVRTTVKAMKELAVKNIYVIDPVFPPRWNLLGNLLFKLDRGQYTRSFRELDNLLVELGFKIYRQTLKNCFPYRVCVFKFSLIS